MVTPKTIITYRYITLTMIVEETDFRSLIAISSVPIATTVHRYKDVYFGLAHIGESIYLALARDGPKEFAPFIEYDIRTKEYSLIESSKGFSRVPSRVVIPVINVKKLSGDVGEEIKKIIEKT